MGKVKVSVQLMQELSYRGKPCSRGLNRQICDFFAISSCRTVAENLILSSGHGTKFQCDVYLL